MLPDSDTARFTTIPSFARRRVNDLTIEDLGPVNNIGNADTRTFLLYVELLAVVGHG